MTVTMQKASVGTCSCGKRMEVNGQTEYLHMVWAMRPDGSKSNLGVCPTTWGGIEGAKARLRSLGLTWPGAGFLVLGKWSPDTTAKGGK